QVIIFRFAATDRKHLGRRGKKGPCFGWLAAKVHDTDRAIRKYQLSRLPGVLIGEPYDFIAGRESSLCWPPRHFVACTDLLVQLLRGVTVTTVVRSQDLETLQFHGFKSFGNSPVLPEPQQKIQSRVPQIPPCVGFALNQSAKLVIYRGNQFCVIPP